MTQVQMKLNDMGNLVEEKQQKFFIDATMTVELAADLRASNELEAMELSGLTMNEVELQQAFQEFLLQRGIIQTPNVLNVEIEIHKIDTENEE
ncbi:hypothetical protein [Bacillus sp. AFS017336]|uniref:hypothetical protein n=1 Tax=Bacillus sp. AFS017336 TaxID=2033489 RepID=UPI000BEF9544|nr:hypothetical protein [Bacillus sp. AFS017336]PEL13808.1 hypothetical protein CN601_03595 [Bacillus sp. AFS017336]